MIERIETSHGESQFRWAVGVTTAPRRKPTLDRTLQSLQAAGWREPRLYAEPETHIPLRWSELSRSRRDDRLGAFPNFYLALTELVLREPRADGYLMCQDDVVFARGAREYLESSLWPNPTVGVLSLYCPSHYAVGKPRGWHAENRGWRSWGALAYLFSGESARSFLTDPLVLAHRDYGPASGMRNVDSVVGGYCERNCRNYYVHVPSLAQHIGETSTIWTRGGALGRRRASEFITEISLLSAIPKSV